MSLKLNSPLVSSDWLAENLQDPDIRILDCALQLESNPDGSYGFVSALPQWQQGHIPNSIYVDVATELSDPDHEFSLMMPAPETFAGIMHEKGIGDGTAVVCYDRSNHAWAARVWWMLRVCGFDNAAVLDGGWQHWLALGLETTTKQTSYPPAEKFTVRPRPGLMASKLQVQTAVEDREIQILHSLPLPVFTGEMSPYPRPGRIPGSKHLYCESLVDSDTHCYLDKDTIRAKITGADIVSGKVITYCGGGIAASANALALTLAGYEDVAVYDGSLTEWTADPAMPLETG